MPGKAPPTPELLSVVSDLRRHLAWQESAGGASLLVERGAAARPASVPAAAPSRKLAEAPPPPPPTPAPAKAAQARSAASAAKPAAPRAAPGAAPRSVEDLPAVPAYTEDDRKPLDQLRRELGDCRRCKLCEGRKQVVFGVGNPRARLVFVGEGPGADEDAQGVPFVGAAGQLLTKMIEAMGFSRDEVYICNVVKCRPPENRTPELEEIAACEPFLRAQLGSIQPKVIVALGKTAVQTLLRQEESITRIRGQWRSYAGIQLMPTFHPSYLLRRPEEKKHVWADLQQVMKVFGKEPKR